MSVFAQRRGVVLGPVLPTLALDSSGNARHMTYEATNPDLSWGAVGPFASGPNRAVATPYPLTNVNHNWANRAPSTDFNVAAWTMGAWVWSAVPGLYNYSSIFGNGLVDGSGHVEGQFITYNTNLGQVIMRSGQLVEVDSVHDISHFAWHHVAASYDGTTGGKVYIDGVPDASSSFTFTDGLVGPVGQSIGGVWQDPNVGQQWPGRIAGVFFCPSKLSDAQVAAIAACTTAATYKSAVLAQSPLGLWMLDE